MTVTLTLVQIARTKSTFHELVIIIKQKITFYNTQFKEICFIKICDFIIALLHCSVDN